MTGILKHLKYFITASLFAAIVLMLPQNADAQRPSLGGIDQKLDEVLDRLDAVEALLRTTTQKNVFITSLTYDGDLGGLTGADAKCQAQADAAGLPGVYKAWLSDSTGSPSTRFTQSTLPYVLPDGATVAASYVDLTDGALLNSINRDENGNLVALINGLAWSNTDTDGTERPNPLSCTDWEDNTGGSFQSTGWVGNSTETGPDWTGTGISGQARFCNILGPLYCFQQ